MRFWKKSIICLLAFTFCLPLAACGGGKKTANCTATPVEFDGIEKVDNPVYYSSLVSNEASDNGIIVCPYFALTVAGAEVPVYSTRCAKNLHSFAYVNIEKTDKDKGFDAEVVLTALDKSDVLNKKNASVAVLPEKRGVTAEISGKTVKAHLTDYGSFTFTFNKKSEQALTIYLAEKETLKVPEGWDTVELQAEKHTMAETTFKNSETVYVFKRGRHLVDCITIPSDSWVYLEDGAYLEAYPDGDGANSAVFYSRGGKNVKFFGHGIVDFSADAGGENGEIKKGAFNFYGIENFTVKGVVSINSNTWTWCFTNCENVYIEGVMAFGYRVFSDGIMLSDCRDSLVTKCFVRTGDDGMETKSTSGGAGQTRNVVYRDNDCWTDKGKAYGVIWETNSDVEDVYFKDCSVGFALANWSAKTCALNISLGDNYYSVRNIHFENIEIYRCESESVIGFELCEQGNKIENIYIKNVHCKSTASYLLKLWEHDVANSNARFGDIYLDNVSKNGVKLTPENMDDKNLSMTKFIITTKGWTPEKFIHINTL